MWNSITSNMDGILEIADIHSLLTTAESTQQFPYKNPWAEIDLRFQLQFFSRLLNNFIWDMRECCEIVSQHVCLAMWQPSARWRYECLTFGCACARFVEMKAFTILVRIHARQLLPAPQSIIHRFNTVAILVFFFTIHSKFASNIICVWITQFIWLN